MSAVHLVTEDGIEQWACEQSAAGDLPWLMRRLIRVTAGSDAKVRFETGKGIYGRSFDGVVQSDGIGNVPDGYSVWEVSTDSGVPSKASSDYNKRTTSDESIDRKNTTYIGVSLRRWGGKGAWEEEKRRDGIWKDVRFLDATDISEWLDQQPILAYQFCYKFSLASVEVRSLEEWWTNWIKDCKMPIGLDWLLAGRDQEAVNFQDIVQQSRRSIWVTGSGMTEALAFAFSAIKALPEEVAESLLSRTLYVPDIRALSVIGATVQNAIIVPMFGIESSHQQGLLEGSNTFLFCGHPDAKPGSIHLPPIRSMVLHERMTRDGVEFEQAIRASKAARTGIELLRKELGASPLPFDLCSIESSNPRTLAVLLLLNRWNFKSESDRLLITKLSKSTYEEVEDILQILSRGDPPIVRRSGTVWFLTDGALAWDQCGSYVTTSLANEFRDVVASVLSEDDPSFDLNPDDRWKAGIFGKHPAYSDQVKEGLGRTLSLLSERAGNVAAFESGQGFVDSVVVACLKGATDRTWFALANVLSLLAESSPEQFLRHLESDLDLAIPQSIAGLYALTTDPLTSGSRHSTLLWALERVAWSRDFLLRASRCLCRLNELSFGTATGNNPLSSLREIFLAWHPCTEATVDERLDVLLNLRKNHPATTWELMLRLLPKGHSTAHTTNRPTHREWGGTPTPQLSKDIDRFNDQLVRWVVEDASDSSERLATIAAAYAGYPDRWLNLILDHLQSLQQNSFDEAGRFEIWEAMRSTLSHHERFKDAEWAMAKKQADRYEVVAVKFKPLDPVLRNSWLFELWVEMKVPESRSTARPAREELVRRLRISAMKEIQNDKGLTGVIELAERAKNPETVAETVAEIEVWSGDAEDKLLADCFGSEVQWRKLFAYGYARYMYAKHGTKWVLQKLQSASKLDWTDDQIASLLLCLRGGKAEWDIVDRQRPGVIRAYWKKIRIWWCDTSNADELEYVIDKLVAVSREPDLISWLAGESYGLELEGLETVWLKALRVLTIRKPLEGEEIGRIAHDVARLLEVLSGSSLADLGQLARLEFFYMPLVRFDYRPRAISRVLASDPSFLLELVTMAFKNDGQETDDSSENEAALARNAYEVLREWRDVPGDTGKAVDKERLLAYVREVRKLAADSGHVYGVDSSLGEVFAKSAAGPDGVWPQVAVCAAIEDSNSDVMNQHLLIGRKNERGVTTRAMDTGGEPERAEERKYRRFALARKDSPLVRNILNDLADDYAQEAASEDSRAAMNQDL